MILKCNKCSKSKDETLFWSSGKKGNPNRNFKHTHCKECKRKSDIIRISKDPIKAYFKSILKTASKRNKNFNITLEQIIEMYNKQKGICALSGIKMTTTLYSGHLNYNASIDRINNIEGYSFNNIRLTCTIVNKMKLTMTDCELLTICSKIIENENKDNK